MSKTMVMVVALSLWKASGLHVAYILRLICYGRRQLSERGERRIDQTHYLVRDG
jgi:hypothetical protein